MRYLISRHGTFWFQIRVPKSLVPRYGTHIRQNLCLTERALAQPLAYQLASQWLARFAFEKTGADVLGGVVPPPFPQSVQPYAVQYNLTGRLPPPEAPQPPPPKPSTRNSLDVDDSFDGLLRYRRFPVATMDTGLYRPAYPSGW